MKRYILGALLVAFGLASCANPKKIAEQIHVRGFVGMNVSEFPDARLRFDIENASRKNIHLKDGQLTLNDGRKTLVRITASDVTIRKRTSEIVDIPLKISLNQMQMLISMNKLVKRPGELTVTGEVTVKSGILSKKLNFADKPLTEFLKDIGLDEQDLQKMINQE